MDQPTPGDSHFLGDSLTSWFRLNEVAAYVQPSHFSRLNTRST